MGVEAVRFLKRSAGVVDAWVGDLLVGTLWRVRSPSTAGASWTARPIGEPSSGGLSLREAKLVLRRSQRAAALSQALYPSPEPEGPS